MSGGCADDECGYVPCEYCAGVGCGSCGWTGHYLSEIGSPVPWGGFDASPYVRAFEGAGFVVTHVGTGGGCDAIAVEIPSSRAHVLITDADACVPYCSRGGAVAVLYAHPGLGDLDYLWEYGSDDVSPAELVARVVEAFALLEGGKL